MKGIFALALAVATIILSGCARSALTLDQGEDQLAPVLGSQSEDLQFINHALFACIDQEAEKVDAKKVGLVAVTSTELVLAEGSPNSLSPNEVQHIPISNLDGVAMSGPFLQVVYQSDRYVILPYRWYSDTVDMEQLNALSNLLEQQSVPAMAAADIQWVRGVIRNAEGPGIHVVGNLLNGSQRDHYDEGWIRDAGYTNGNEVIDSQAFTPWQEWGQ